MSSSEVFSLALSAGFGLVSSIGVIYQIKDMRNKSGRSEPPVPVGPVASPVWYGAPPAGPGVYPVPPGPPMYPGGPPAAPPMSGPPSSPAGPVARPVSVPPMSAPPISVPPMSAPPTSPAHPGYPAPPFPMSPAAGPYGAAPPGYPQSAYTVPPGVTMVARPRPPKSIARVRLTLLAITILMIPNVALWMYTSILGGAYTNEEFNDPMTYVGIVGAMIILVVPLATIPTLLSWQIGLGRNWARIVTTVLFVMVGPFCSCFGVFLPFSSLGSEGSVSSSPLMDTGLGIFSLALGVAAVVVVVNLFLPTANRFFRDMTQWRAARAAAVRRA